MTDPTPKLFHYRAKFVDAFDGDTVMLDIDLGLNCWLRNQKMRLFGINTPELRGTTKEAGLQARAALLSLVVHKEVVAETFKDRTEKYGRWLVRLYARDNPEAPWVDVNMALVERGHAVVYMDG